MAILRLYVHCPSWGLRQLYLICPGEYCGWFQTTTRKGVICRAMANAYAPWFIRSNQALEPVMSVNWCSEIANGIYELCTRLYVC